MADLGDLLARLLLDGSQWTAGMKKAESEAAAGATEIEGSLAGISESLGKMGEALAGLAIAEGLKTFAEDAINASNEVGKFKAAIVALKGSGEETTAFLEHVHELAATSPFAFPELAQASKNMVQLGASMEQVTDTMTAITQMGTALKMTSEQVSGIAGAMGKLAAGNDPMRVMKSLVSESVPAWQMLAEQMGTSMPEAQAKVKAGLVSNDEIIKALTASMGTYADTAAGWGNTWAGAMKGFNTETHAAMAAIGDDIKHALSDIGAPVIKALTEGLKDAVSWWKNLSQPVKDAVLAFGGAIGVMAAVGGALALVSAAIAAIGAPIALAVVGIAALVAALVALGEWVNSHWVGISNILVNAWSGIKELWGQTWTDTIGAIEDTWNGFIGGVKDTWDSIVSVVSGVWDAVTGAWSAVWDGILSAIKLVWNTFKTELSIFDSILSYLLPFWEPVKAAFLAVWNEIVGTIETAWGKLKGIFDAATGAGSWLGKVGETFGIVSRAVKNVGDEMSKTTGVVEEHGAATKALTGHLEDNTEQLGKASKAHQEHADKLKASKDATALLWAESAILNGEFQKLVKTVAENRLEADRMAASGKTLADKVTAIKIPTTDATAAIAALGNASAKTMGQIAGMSTVTGAAETALKQMGVTSSAQYKQLAADALAAYNAVVNNPLSTEWDKANAKAKDLQAQIANLTAAEGDHAAELEVLKRALNTTTTEIANMSKTTSDSYHDMNLKTSADLQAIMDKDAERWKAAKDLADSDTTGNPYLVKQQKQAELDMLNDQKQFGDDWSAADEARRKQLEKDLGTHLKNQKDAWDTFGTNVQKDVGAAFDGLIDKVVTGKGSFGDLLTNLWQSLAKDCLNLFIAPIKSAVEDLVKNTLSSLLGGQGFGGISSALGDIGGKIKDVFSGGGGGGGGGVPGVPGTGGAGDATGAASSAFGSIGSMVSVISGAVSAITGVIGIFQSAKQETTLNAIEHNTRYTMMYVGERADGGILGVLFKIDEEIAWGAQTKAIENLRDLFLDWSNLVAPIFKAIQISVEGIAPFVQDSTTALQDIREIAAALPNVITQGFHELNVTVTATGVTTAEAAKALGDQIAANLSRQLVPTT
jgi:tape measure domain-containing protein